MVESNAGFGRGWLRSASRWGATISVLGALAVAATWLLMASRPPVSAFAVQQAAAAKSKKSPADPADAFFADAKIRRVEFRVVEPQVQRLREDARRYVPATLVESGKTYEQVGLKLKGAAGSFRGVDDRPAYTVNVDRERKKQDFHGLQKFHLNNSVQDESYLSEWTCAALCEAAGLPAPRVSFAEVKFNDRDWGLYVLKEAFDKPFLKRYFADPDGNLYDGGFLQDIDANLEKDSGRGPDDFSDLKGLLAACREPDPAMRWKLIEERLDLNNFLTFMAVERLQCHWDGYTMNRNNYRIYFDPKTGKAHFLPHGMDQMFGDPGFPLFHRAEPIVAAAVLQNPKWRAAYRRRIEQLLPQYTKENLLAIADRAEARLRPYFESRGADAVRHHEERARDFKGRLAARYEGVVRQLQEAEPLPVEFDAAGRYELKDWFVMQDSADAQLQAEEVGGRKRWRIRAGASGHCVASWRQRVLLEQGSYEVEATIATRGVEPLPDETGRGAGIRISGGRRDNQVVGDSKGQKVVFAFEVQEPTREVMLVNELRATRGEAVFLAPTLVKKK
ncbi:MAG: CotH kinase family protein [Pirellulales bacterium]